MRQYTAVIQAGDRIYIVEQTGEGDEATSAPVFAAVAKDEPMAEWIARTISHQHNLPYERAANMAPALDKPESADDT